MKIRISELQKKHAGDQLGLKSAVQAALDSDGLIDDDGADVEEVDLDGVVLKKSAGGVPDWASELRQSFKALADKAAATEKELTELKAKAARRSVISGVRDVVEDDPKGGFRHIGEQLLSIKNAAFAARYGGGQVDKRLLTLNAKSWGSLENKAASTFTGTGIGSEGGFLIAPDFSMVVEKYVTEDTPIMELCSKRVTSSNNYTWHIDENTPWGTTGVRVYWTGEGDDITASKINVKRATMTLQKIAALCPVSEEEMEDAAYISSYIPEEVGRKMSQAITNSIIAGTGGNQMKGILGSLALVSVAKETSQTAATINVKNIDKMWMRMHANSRRNAVWFYNQDAEEQINSLEQITKVTNVAVTENVGGSGTPLMRPAAGLSGEPVRYLYGRPLIPLQACATLGTVGDIILADMTQYQVISKTAGTKMAISAEFYFGSDQQAFRFTHRIDGQSKWSGTYAAKNGSATYSPFVALATRA